MRPKGTMIKKGQIKIKMIRKRKALNSEKNREVKQEMKEELKRSSNSNFKSFLLGF